uniref:PH domain-containing protein n=1 Tax=Parascaris equorum TaxID=6256 RepID=A0A914S5R6_PAREQ
MPKERIYSAITATDDGVLLSVQSRHVLDMRDTDFTVTGVTEADVIHASKSDLPKIFRVTTSQIHGVNTTSSTSSSGSASSEGPVARQYTLLMADNNEEKTKWVIALNELKSLLRKSKLPDKTGFFNSFEQ